MASCRNSSIELLRILSMMTIIGVHYWNSCGTLDRITPEDNSYMLLKALEVLLSYGVNIFVIITGYFMIDRESVNIRKVVDLIWKIAFWGCALFFASIWIGINTFRISGLVKSILPIIFGYRWFIKAYIILYLLIPYINRLIHSISKRQLEILIILLLILFSLWPFCLPNPPIDDYGFGFTNFIVIYIIAAYLKIYANQVSLLVCFTTFIICSFAIWGIVVSNFSLPLFNTMRIMAIAHNSPIKLVACFSLFLTFTKWTWNSKTINTLASSAFAVYIIHGDFNIMDYVFTNMFDGGKYQHDFEWFAHMSIVITLIYLGCFCMDFLANCIYKTINAALDRISSANKLIEA